MIAAVISGGVLALAFPSVNISLCAWVGLVPLLWSVARVGPARAMGFGWLCGFTFFLGTLYWVIHPIHYYTNAPLALAVLALLLLAAVLGLYTAAFAGLASIAIRGRLVPMMTVPALWVAVEWVRSSGPLGFPWVALGYSQFQHHNLVQVAEVTGVYGISALCVYANAVFYWVVWGEGVTRLRRGAALMVLGGLLAFLYVAGGLRREMVAQAPQRGHLTVGVVQANVDQGRKWDPQFAAETIDRHMQLALRAKRDGAELVVWPETAAPFYFQSETRERERLVNVAKTAGIHLLFGSPAFGYEDGALQLFNRAYLVRRDGSVGGSYDKLRLVPFGEYVPLQPLLFFVDKIVEGVGNFVPGREATVFTLPAGRFGVLICYEGIFPNLSRELVRRGADFLVNITNDAWFGKTSAPHQHLAMVTLRAVENRVPIVRAANTGVSAIVDIDGSIRWQTDLFRAAVRADVVGWPGISTFYTRYGDVFAGVCGLASLAVIGYAVRDGRLRRAQRHG